MTLSIGAPEALSEIPAVLKRGGVVIMPCDTIYGFVGRAPDTENRIRSIKGRGETKPFLRLVPSVTEVRRLSDQVLDEKILSYWPGPLTLIVTCREGGTIALRIPGDDRLIRLMEALGTSLYSTSVNRSGEASLWRIADIEKEFSTDVDLIVSAGDLENRSASTILDITAKPYRIVRQGELILPEELLS